MEVSKTSRTSKNTRDDKPPKVSIGLPVYNGSIYIRSALDSLLVQTFDQFELVISDNASTDGTFEICKEYAARDGRIALHRFESNKGLLANFRQVFQLSQNKYFAWAGDHDLWQPHWLESLVKVLDSEPTTVLAYPSVIGIGPNGEELFRDTAVFETAGLNRQDRIRAACSKMVGAGNMVYGLFRADALRKTSVNLNLLMPDRLLLMELALQGGYRAVREPLWKRRYSDAIPRRVGFSDEEQETINERRRRNLFEGKAPWHSYLPTLTLGLGLVYRVSFRSGFRNINLGPYMAYLFCRRRRQLIKAESKALVKRLMVRT